MKLNTDPDSHNEDTANTTDLIRQYFLLTYHTYIRLLLLTGSNFSNFEFFLLNFSDFAQKTLTASSLVDH